MKLYFCCVAILMFVFWSGCSDSSTQPEEEQNPPINENDQAYIVFTSERDGNQEIYVMNDDGNNQVRITNHSSIDWFPDWSPEGARIAFGS